MVLHALRALFVLLMAAVGWSLLRSDLQPFGDYTWLAMTVTLSVGVFIVCIDILAPRRKLAVFAGTLFGLAVGVLLAYGLSFVVRLLVDFAFEGTDIARRTAVMDFTARSVNILVGIVCCYLSISFILQTKDDFRFIIPYVEFSKQTRGARPIVLDTSVLIDGRIAELAHTGVFESQLVVPRFVLNELQTVADNPDRLKRNRGRRGLDVLAVLQKSPQIDLRMYESSPREASPGDPVDQRLVALASEIGARILTGDYNLAKVAELTGVQVINLNEIANALKPAVLPGERMTVRIVKPGEEAGQGVGYLADGTMVVVEHARNHLNEDVEFTITNAVTTSAGRMVFGRIGDPNGGPRRQRPRGADEAE